jgi:acetate kinase
MGLTPTAGLIMGTRSGDIDPGVLLYLMNEKQLDAASLERLLNTSSGLLGISGSSSDMQTLLDLSATDPRAAVAVELFCYSARKHIAAMSAALEGIETLVFTGGIGERAAPIRARICLGLQYLGIEIDPEANARDERSIGNGAMAVRTLVIPTDEARMIARHSFGLLR